MVTWSRTATALGADAGALAGEGPGASFAEFTFEDVTAELS